MLAEISCVMGPLKSVLPACWASTRAACHCVSMRAAAQGKAEASCPFEYAARLTETMLLGVVALHAGKKIQYDGENMRVTNVSAANEFLKREYRTGW